MSLAHDESIKIFGTYHGYQENEGLLRMAWESSHGLCCVLQERKGWGLHTLLDMVGYCMKYNGEESFECHNVFLEDMNDGKNDICKVKEGGFE